MTRDEFMGKALGEVRQILQGKENGIMGLVQRAWAEGKRNAEVETLRAAIDEALNRREPKVVPKEDAVYPTWLEWLCEIGVIPNVIHCEELYLKVYHGVHDNRIPADIAEKLGIQPREGE